MKLPRKQLVGVIQNLFKSESVKGVAKQVGAYLLEQKRTNELDSIMRDVLINRAKLGILEVNVISAHELDATTLLTIKEQIRSLYPDMKNLILNQTIDGDLVGGVKLEMPDRQLDLSVRQKLSKLRQLTGAGV